MSQIFRHYKNKDYKLLGTAKHSETLEELALYQTLYANPSGRVWVRPKAMFYEEIFHDGKTQPRFKPLEFEIQDTNVTGPEDLLSIFPLVRKIFSEKAEEKLRSKISTVNNAHLWIAYFENQLVGYKLGYEKSVDSFYSWSGGVDPDWRERGVAQALMDQQHAWAQKNGYKQVSTKTTNRWQNMLVFNIRQGFKIVGTEDNPDGELRILLEKNI